MIALPGSPDWACDGIRAAASAGVLRGVHGASWAGVTASVAIQYIPGRVCYLATPFTRRALWSGAFSAEHAAAAVAEANLAALHLFRHGVTALSPIVMAMGICGVDPEIDPLDQTKWTAWCAPMLALCPAVVVACEPGWDRSAGVWHEVREALTRNKPVILMRGGAE